MPNRLADETSPYLLQHKDNPVDWYPWGAEAFEKARQADKPILLSVGYSACHWCHVMEHESFEHHPTAQMMNEYFVNIKVDREERPDVDAIYMEAVQAMTHHGGWPMTVFLLPDGRPFYGGTYFPREARYGMPAFRQVLSGVHEAYTERRGQVEDAADQLKQALERDHLGIGGDQSALGITLTDAAAAQMIRNFDRTHGGFGGAPKFPQPMNLEFLLRVYARNRDPQLLQVVTHTLDRMARGGIYDQLGGGFARYSVDAIWLVPHFEKMLYDNAQLSRVYLHAWQITGNDFFRQIAEEIYDYILREMTAPEGGFYSATDADSEGEEGKFFVWSIAEIEQIVGQADAQIAIEYWGMSERGNFEGHNILYRPNTDDVIAKRLGLSVDELLSRIITIKDRLFAARSQRVHPGLDDKILTAWNGLMLASLAEAARVLKRADYRLAAERAGHFLVTAMIHDEDRLYRTHKNGHSKLNGYLEDYAMLIDALIELYQLTFDPQWFSIARKLADRVLAHFGTEEGGFYDVSDDHEKLIVRPRGVQDNAIPSGNGMIAKVFVQLSAYTGDPRYDEAARGGLQLLVNAIQQYPQAFAESAGAIELIAAGVKEVAIVGDPALETTQLLLDAVNTAYRPNVIRALTAENMDGEHPIPLLSYRMMRGHQPTVYVCEHFMCKLPVTMIAEVEDLLKT